jgi:hypothetical protein
VRGNVQALFGGERLVFLGNQDSASYPTLLVSYLDVDFEVIGTYTTFRFNTLFTLTFERFQNVWSRSTSSITRYVLNVVERLHVARIAFPSGFAAPRSR